MTSIKKKLPKRDHLLPPEFLVIWRLESNSKYFLILQIRLARILLEKSSFNKHQRYNEKPKSFELRSESHKTYLTYSNKIVEVTLTRSDHQRFLCLMNTVWLQTASIIQIVKNQTRLESNSKLKQNRARNAPKSKRTVNQNESDSQF